jgi:RNA polymerase sigma-70 factor (ECF subfamily)
LANAPTTRYSLLVRLEDRQDERAWGEFVRIYEPVILRLAQARGFQAADAADITQEVFGNVAAAIERWNRKTDRGPFRAWLFTIARNLMINALAKRRRQPAFAGDPEAQAALENQAATVVDDGDLIDREYEREVFHFAADEVKGEFRDRSWQAFWRTAVMGETIGIVAAELGMTVGAIYIARSRVMTRLKQRIEEVEGKSQKLE